MRQEHKQKVLLGVVGALSLGAGSYWFFGESADTSGANFTDGPVARRAAAAPEQPTSERKSGNREVRPEPAPPSRKEREPEVDQPSGRKPRPRSDKIEKKKPPPRAS